MKRYDLNLLAALDALLRERTVSGAARRLGVGQPAMSAALARLRALFDDPLFVRGARGMEPTPRALALAEPLRGALDELGALIKPTGPFAPATASRTFRISGGDYVGMALIPPLSALVAHEAPGIDLRFRYIEKDQVPGKLDAEDIDLALLVAGDLPPRFRREPLFAETFVCAARAGHPLFDRPLDPARFASLDHLLVTERGDERGSVDDVLQAQGLARRIAMTVPSAALVADILRVTDMIATIPRRAADRIAADGSIRLIEPPLETPRWHMSMVWAARSEREPGLAWLRATLRRLAACD